LIDELVKNHDYTGLVLHLVDNLKEVRLKVILDNLLTGVTNGLILPFHTNQSLRHKACCCLRKGLHNQALELSAWLSSRYPDDLDLQVFNCQVLYEKPGTHEETTKLINDIRNSYNIDKKNGEILKQIEDEIVQ